MSAEGTATTHVANQARFGGQIEVEYGSPLDGLHWSETYNVIAAWLQDYRRPPATNSVWESHERHDASESGQTGQVTTIRLTRMFAMRSLARSSALLKDATITLSTDEVSPESSLILIRCALEAAAVCRWLTLPSLERDERLRRTNIYLFHTLVQIASMLPKDSPPASSGDDDPYGAMFARQRQNELLEEATKRGWTLGNGKPPRLRSWKHEFPSPSDDSCG